MSAPDFTVSCTDSGCAVAVDAGSAFVSQAGDHWMVEGPTGQLCNLLHREFYTLADALLSAAHCAVALSGS